MELSENEKMQIFQKTYEKSNNPKCLKRFTEELSPPLDLDALDMVKKQMAEDENFSKLLTTPGKYLGKYKYLVIELSKDTENETLLDIIERSLANEKIISRFSMVENKITGFVGYTVEDGIVSNIKMFSLLDEKKFNIGLYRDLKKLIIDLRKDSELILWSAIKENPANNAYRKIIEEFNGSVREHKQKKSNGEIVSILNYRIHGDIQN